VGVTLPMKRCDGSEWCRWTSKGFQTATRFNLNWEHSNDECVAHLLWFRFVWTFHFN